MAAGQRPTLQASSLQAASSQSNGLDVLTAVGGWVFLDVSAVSGTGTPQMSAWLQGWDGVGWFDLFHNGAGPTADATQADQTAAAAGKRNINGASVITAAGKYSAFYPQLPTKIRLRWNITGTFTSVQGFTFSATADVK